MQCKFLSYTHDTYMPPNLPLTIVAHSCIIRGVWHASFIFSIYLFKILLRKVGK